MALFSRRPKKPADSEPTEAPQASSGQAASGSTPAETTTDASTPAETATDASTPAETTTDAATPAGTTAEAAGEPTPSEAPAAASSAEADAAASVSISVSSFGGLGATPAQSAPPAPPRLGARAANEVAPAPSETIPGLRDNVLLREALARVPDGPPSQTLLDVARQLLQGHVFLRVKGDARTLLSEGKDLPLAVATVGERTFGLVYSSGAALQASLRADGDADTSAMAQPVMSVLRHVLASSYDGIIIDPASAPARAVLPRELLQRLVDQADTQLTVKTLLVGERTPATAAAVAAALVHTKLWVAVGQAEGGVPGLAEGRLPDGSRYLEVYSHPLEVAVTGRGDNAAPLTGAQLAKALMTDAGLSGVVVDPAGPWIRLTRQDLAPLLALVD
ncbi:SseB family protein [Microbacterium cremeum]|uniref:SseB family protein n=1 Tax=Microbacterium cremeum TaxID=2782169 RepID=UPI001888B2F3|nr:SseB family protein [Microbacterium cremeum]